MMLSHTIFVSWWLCLFAIVTRTSVIDNATIVHHTLNPSVYLLYQVSLSDFQKYIDPRLPVATFGNQAYIVIYFSNESVSYGNTPSLSSYPAIDIYTIVKFKNILSRETLFTSLDNALFVPVCQPYTMQPYGCYLMNSSSSLTVNNQTQTYRFYSSTFITRTNKVAKANLTINFLPTAKVNYNDLSNLAGFYLGNANNQNSAQSLYQRKRLWMRSMIPPIFTLHLYNLFYTDIYNCTISSLQSNYIRAAIGEIIGLNENEPTLCLYTPFTSSDSTIATPAGLG